MAETVRIDPVTYERLAQLAKDADTTLQEQLRRAVESFEQKRFFERLEEQLAARSAQEIAEDEAEISAWDCTLLDGLEGEPPYEDDRLW